MVAGSQAGASDPLFPAGGGPVGDPVAPTRERFLGRDLVCNIAFAIQSQRRQQRGGADAPGIQMIPLGLNVRDQIAHHGSHLIVRRDSKEQRNRV